jgi:hypothetical protein
MGEVEQALRITGLVQGHSAMMEETRPLLETALSVLRARFSAEDFQASLAAGAATTLEEMSVAWLSSPVDSNGQEKQYG